MNISLKSLVAGAALSASVCAVILGVTILSEQPSVLSLSYIGGGVIGFKVALRTLLPNSLPLPGATREVKR